MGRNGAETARNLPRKRRVPRKHEMSEDDNRKIEDSGGCQSHAGQINTLTYLFLHFLTFRNLKLVNLHSHEMSGFFCELEGICFEKLTFLE